MTSSSSNKKGIILLSTILLMGILISIIAINTEITKKNFDLYNQTKIIYQNDIIFQNIISLFHSKASLVKSKTIFDVITAQKIDFNDSKTSLSLSIKMKPSSTKININNLIPNNKIPTGINIAIAHNKVIYAIISQLLQEQNVQDEFYFLDLLMDSIDMDLNERASLSEISLMDERFENGGVFSNHQLDIIKEHYITQTKDYSINEVDFNKYFRFEDGLLDIHHMPKSLISKITRLDDFDIKKIFEENEEITNLAKTFGEEHNTTFSELGVRTSLRVILCDVGINVFEKQTTISFEYDFSKRTINNVKFKY